MPEKQISSSEYEEYLKLKAAKVKSKRYTAVLNAKQKLQADWAELNSCPIGKKHAEFYVDLNKPLRDRLSTQQIITFVETWDDKKVKANAHVKAMLETERGKPTVGGEIAPEEDTATKMEGTGTPDERETQDKEPSA